MAKKIFYLPRGDREKLTWFKNFSQKFTGYAASLGFTPAEAVAVADDLNMFEYTFMQLANAKARLKGLTAYKDALIDSIGGPISYPTAPVIPAPPANVPRGIFRRVRKTVQRIKGHPNYNTAMGKDLGIIGAEIVVDYNALKPKLKTKLNGTYPVIIWKKGVADSINIYVDRRDGKGFVFLANDVIPDYIDTHPLPAGVDSDVWDYKARYRVGDNETGQFSDEVSVTVTRGV